MEGDLIERITGALSGFPIKEFVDARRRGGVTVRRWDKEARVDVYKGFDRLPDNGPDDIIELANNIALVLRSLDYRVHIGQLDEHHSYMTTFTPGPRTFSIDWSPQ
jgi:hypothetical protein